MTARGLLIAAAIVSSAGDAAGAILLKDAEGVVTVGSGLVMKQFASGEKAVFNSKDGLMTAVFPERQIYTTFTRAQFCSAIRDEETGPGVREARPWTVLDILPRGYHVSFTEDYDVQELDNTPRVVVVSEPIAEVEERGPPRVKIVESGKGGKVAGYKTTLYKIYVNGQLEEQVWMASDKRLLRELDKLDMSIILGFFQCDERVDRGEAGVAANEEYRKLFEKGWPLRIKSDDDDAYYRVSNIEIRDVPREEFGIPMRYDGVPFERSLLGIDDAD